MQTDPAVKHKQELRQGPENFGSFRGLAVATPIGLALWFLFLFFFFRC